MRCKYCTSYCQKAGKQKNGTQKWHCSSCKRYQQKEYRYHAYNEDINTSIVSLLKEGCGIRSISRLLSISTTTTMRRILWAANEIQKPHVFCGKTYEMDEIRTYIGKKKRMIWIVYAIRRDTREVMDFKVGPRTNRTLTAVLKTLELSSAKAIYTDGLKHYRYLIQKEVHRVKHRGTNYIERKNLTLRTHLKRLNRRTICFSRSLVMLIACLKIYFWG